MKTKTARGSQVLSIAVTIGFALAILLVSASTGSAQTLWTVSPSPTPTNNIYYNAGNVGIGTNAPDQKLVVSANSATTLPASVGNIQLFGANGVQPIAAIDGFAAAPLYLLRRANNTAASPSAVQANDLMGAFGVAGYGSTAYQGTRARVGFFASENWTNSANGTYMVFSTTANGAASAGGTERMRLDSAGNLGIGTATPTSKLTVSLNTGTLPAPTVAGTVAQFANADGTSARVLIDSFGAAPALDFRRSSTTAASPSALLLDHIMGAVSWSGYGSTAYSSAARAYVRGNAAENWSDTAQGTYLTFGTTAKTTTTTTERMRIDDAGKIGIGTTTPVAQLDVRTGTVALPPGGGLDPNVFHTWLPYADGKNYIRGTTIIADQGGNVLIGNPTPSGNKVDVAGTINATGLIVGTSGLTVNGNPITGSANDLWSGTVATARLGSGSASATTFLRGDNTWAVPSGATQWTGTDSISYTAGNVGIGTPATQYKLDVNGNTNVTGNINITGNINAKFQDMAEWVTSSEQVRAGTVVVLDTTKSNQVISSTQAYDTRVAGVVSEQPGIALGESGKGKVLVATTGRVLVKVDATNSPIHIGDLLVTSDISGVAMKSEPITIGNRKIHTPGTLIGKALEPLEKGSGKILVLLSLQ